MLRVGRRLRVKSGPRAGRRAGGPSVTVIAGHRVAKRPRPASPAVRHEWTSFVTRCLRSWEVARDSATQFLATWTPLGIPDAKPSVRRHRGKRRASAPKRRSGQRAAQHPIDAMSSPAWQMPIAAAGSAEALRARYPFVSALLVELASTAPQRRPRRAQRG
jgi:hypothetical protein